MRINGHVLPSPSEQWAPFFEEFFFHTSRYFPQRLCELQKIAGKECAQLYDFHAEELTNTQRFVLSWMMTTPVDRQNVESVLKVLERFHDLDTKQH